MAIVIQIPGSMKKWFNNSGAPECSGKTIRECLDSLERRYPGVKKKILDEQGQPAGIAIFVNGNNMLHLNGLETEVQPNDNISMIPMVAGG